MARKIARKVLDFELALIKVPLEVFESTVGDRLPEDSVLRRTVERAAETIDQVTSRGRKKKVRMAEPAKRTAANRAAATTKPTTSPPATGKPVTKKSATKKVVKKAPGKATKKTAKKAAAKRTG